MARKSDRAGHLRQAFQIGMIAAAKKFHGGPDSCNSTALMLAIVRRKSLSSEPNRNNQFANNITK
jgi:hypothetical protein